MHRMIEQTNALSAVAGESYQFPLTWEHEPGVHTNQFYPLEELFA